MLACPVGVLVDVPCITVIAILKSPLMLLKGWKRLMEDLIGREGPFLETVCVPFAGIAILLWPLACVGAVIAAIVASFFLGLYSGVIAYQVQCVPQHLFALAHYSTYQCVVDWHFFVVSEVCA